MSITKEEMTEALKPLKDDLHLVKEGLFHPDTGIYARVQRNTLWRKVHMYIYGAVVTALALGGVQYLLQ